MGEFEKLMLHLGLGESPVNEKLREMAALRSLRKGDQMSCADKTRYVYFLISGVMRGYIIDNNGREITDCFVFKYGQGYMDFLEAGISDMPTEWLEAETEVELMCFDAARLSPLVLNSLELSRIYNRMLTVSYAEHWVHKLTLYSSTAMERYRWFLSTYPGLIDLVPHKHIASFLAMTPVTLSRLRRSARQEDQ